MIDHLTVETSSAAVSAALQRDLRSAVSAELPE